MRVKVRKILRMWGTVTPQSGLVKPYASPAPKASTDLANATFNKAFAKVKNRLGFGCQRE